MVVKIGDVEITLVVRQRFLSHGDGVGGKTSLSHEYNSAGGFDVVKDISRVKYQSANCASGSYCNGRIEGNNLNSVAMYKVIVFLLMT